ncbi:phage tail protein [Bacillus solitudinis]|uniref:phage tail protein n=1 Tax=Bacillus solitudinis TaxID=2014074 RepID=UPI001D0D2D38|nr:phage tail protein [Bacillus solitudinis]
MKMLVTSDEKMLNDVQERLSQFPQKAPNAISSALNRGVTNMNSNSRKEIRKDYNIKAGDISPTLKVFRASRASLGASVQSKGGVIPLERFKISPKTINPKRKTPIKAAVKKGGAKSLGSGFVADISGPKVFKRTGESRLPIKRLFGPSVPQMLENERAREEIQKQGQETFEKRLEHEINRILEKGRA